MRLSDIPNNIGKTVTIGGGDIAIRSELRSMVFNEEPLTIVKITKGGEVYLQKDNKFYTVPARYVHLG